MPFLIFGVLGGHEGRFTRKTRLGLYKYKKKKTVRGVAMNPCDHHNGGSSKTKKPFLNKYFKIAKNSK